ncbi:MAG: hypothetical protein JXB47_18075 [Anaerolineae bacterium]|nr:hypothetical protein [Anaerolineae bacterium]
MSANVKKVPRHKIRRLYESDALRFSDEDLINDVAYGFYARCLYLLGVPPGEVEPAPRRRAVVERPAEWEGFVKRARYPWEVAGRVELAPDRYRRSGDDESTAAMRHFVAELPHARRPREKMLLINQLTHACHDSLKTDEPRPLAVDLIAGAKAKVLAMFDDLAYGRRDLPGIKAP